MPISILFAPDTSDDFDADLIKYQNDGYTVVPIKVSESIVTIEVSNFDFSLTQGFIEDAFIHGEDTDYSLNFLPSAHEGIVTISATGKVFPTTAGGLSDSQILTSGTLMLPYNNIEPDVISTAIPPLLTAGIVSVYVDFNTDVEGINSNSFETNFTAPTVYAAPNPSTALPKGFRPDDASYTEYTNSELPRKFFRLDFEFPNPPPIGNLNINLKENEALGYIDLSDITYVAPMMGEAVEPPTPFSFFSMAQSDTPTLSMQDAVIDFGQDFRHTGTVNGNASHVYVEGLQRGWSYDWNSSTGALAVFGDADNTKSVEMGVWTVYMGDGSVSTSFTSQFDYGYVETGVNVGLNYGDESSAFNNENDGNYRLVREEIENAGYAYRVNTHLFESGENLRVRLYGDKLTNHSVIIRCRYADTKPTALNLTTHGRQLFSQTIAQSTSSFDFNGDILSSRAGAGTYIWLYASADTEINFTSLEFIGREIGEESDTVDWEVRKRSPVIMGDDILSFVGNVDTIIPIENSPEGVSAEGLQMGLKATVQETGAGIVGHVSQTVALSENRQFVLNASSSAGTDTKVFRFHTSMQADITRGIAERIGGDPVDNFGVNTTLPSGLAFDPNTDTLYMVSRDNSNLYTVNTSTGAATRVGTSNNFGVNEGDPTGLAFDSNSNTLYMVGLDNLALFTVNTSTGVATRVGSSTRFGISESTPTGLAFDSDTDTLYMVGLNNLALLTVNTSTGVATRVGSSTRFGVSESGSRCLAFDPNTNTLYMSGSSNRVLFTLDTSTGVATRVGSSTEFGVSESDPQGLAFDSNSDTLYMLGNTNDALFTVNTSTGVATRVGSATRFGLLDTTPTGLAFNPNTDTLYMVDQINRAIYSLNTTSSIATHLTGNPSYNFGVNETAPSGLAFDPNTNTLYMVGRINRVLYTLDISTGAATRVGTSNNFGVNETSPRGLAFDPNTNTLYMVGSSTIRFYTLDTSTGVATRVGTATRFDINESNPRGLAFDPNTNTLYMAGSTFDALFTLDTSTGVATRIGSATEFGANEADPHGLAFDRNSNTLYMVGNSNDALYTLS